MSRRLEAGRFGEQEEPRHCPQCHELLHFRLGVFECPSCGTVVQNEACAVDGGWQDDASFTGNTEPVLIAAPSPLAPAKLWCYRIFIVRYLALLIPGLLFVLYLSWIGLSPAGFGGDPQLRSLWMLCILGLFILFGISIYRMAGAALLFRQVLSGEATGLNQAAGMFATLAWGVAVLGIGFVFSSSGQLMGQPETPMAEGWRIAAAIVALLEGAYNFWTARIIYGNINSP